MYGGDLSVYGVNEGVASVGRRGAEESGGIARTVHVLYRCFVYHAIVSRIVFFVLYFVPAVFVVILIYFPLCLCTLHIFIPP